MSYRTHHVAVYLPDAACPGAEVAAYRPREGRRVVDHVAGARR